MRTILEVNTHCPNCKDDTNKMIIFIIDYYILSRGVMIMYELIYYINQVLSVLIVLAKVRENKLQNASESSLR